MTPGEPVMLLKRKVAYQVKCDKCHHAMHEFYSVSLGDFNYKFCSLMHANAAKAEYDEKVTKGLTPNNLTPIEDSEGDDGGDTLGAYVE